MAVGSQRILAVSVRTERIGCVVLEDGDLLFWQGSSGRTPSKAGELLNEWITAYRPDIVITENPDTPGKKSGRQVAILTTLYRVANRVSSVFTVTVARRQPFRNVYDEAANLAKQFPELLEILPEPRPIWRKEPYSLVFFEALALVREAGLIDLKPEE